jgi:hypothetical protein
VAASGKHPPRLGGLTLVRGGLDVQSAPSPRMVFLYELWLVKDPEIQAVRLWERDRGEKRPSLGVPLLVQPGESWTECLKWWSYPEPGSW